MHRYQIDTILIFTHDGGTGLSSGLEYFQVTGVPKTERKQIEREEKRYWRIRELTEGTVGRQSTESRGNHGMVHPPTRKIKAGLNIFSFQIGQLFQDLLGSSSLC